MHQESVKHLSFLVRFMEETGITNADVARALQCNRGILTYYLKRDDMLVSKVYSIMDSFGYDIRFRFLKKETSFRKSDAGVDLIMNTRVPQTEVLPRFAGKRLASFRSYMEYYGFTYKSLAERLGISNVTIMVWLRKDDCFISYLYKAAAALGANLEIEITPKPQTPKEQLI